mgnify:CR=1 FL=1
MLRGTGLRKQANEFGYEYDEFAPYEMKRNNALSEEDVHNIHLAEENFRAILECTSHGLYNSLLSRWTI